LQTREYGVSNQDDETYYLKTKFGVFAPFAGLIAGWMIAVWGWWRMRRCASRWQLTSGITAPVLGFTGACVWGLVFMIVVF
jgi:hypothetical protein